MSTELKACGVRLHHAIAHQGEGLHLIGEQAVIAGLVGEGLEEVGGARAERAVCEALECPDAQIRTPEGVPDAYLHLIVDLRDERHGINSSRELAPLEELAVDRDVRIVCDHVLHAAHADRGGVRERAAHGFHALIVIERRDDPIHQKRCGVLQGSGGTTLSIAHDHSARRVGGCGRDAGRAERRRVRKAHVAVITADEYRYITGHGVDQLSSRKLGRGPFRLIPVPSRDPFFLGFACGAFCNPTLELLGARGVVELHVVELRTSVDEMYMRIVEAGQEKLALGIDDRCLWSPPGVDVRIGSDLHDPLAEHCHRLSSGSSRVDRPDFGIGHDQVGGRLCGTGRRGVRKAAAEETDRSHR